MKRNAILLLAGGARLGLIAAGCGGNDDESSDTGTDSTTALTKAEFLKQGNAICQQGKPGDRGRGRADLWRCAEGEEPQARSSTHSPQTQ